MSIKCKVMFVDSVVSAVAETIVLQNTRTKQKDMLDRFLIGYHRRDSTASLNVLVNSQSKRLRMTAQWKNLLICNAMMPEISTNVSRCTADAPSKEWEMTLWQIWKRSDQRDVLKYDDMTHLD